MENASKSLIIAGAILISILLISTGILIFNSIKGNAEQGTKAGEILGTKAEDTSILIGLENETPVEYFKVGTNNDIIGINTSVITKTDIEFINIPAGAGFTEIKSGAFANCTNLKAVKIPDTMTKIGDRAFFKCKSLTTIIIPKSIKTIGKGVFNECTSLRTVMISSELKGQWEHLFPETANIQYYD